MAHVNIQPEKLGQAYKFANLLPTKALRDYATAYINWMRGGAEGLEPERGRASQRAAYSIRENVDAMKLWDSIL